MAETKNAVLPFDGNSPLRTLNSQDVPRRALLHWMKDGQAIAYIKTGGNTSNIWAQPQTVGSPRQLTNYDSELIFNSAFSSTGRLALTRGHENSDVVLISSLN